MSCAQESSRTPVRIEALSAVTLLTRDPARSIRFYESLGFEMEHGGANAPLTSFRAGTGHLNLLLAEDFEPRASWGRVIIYVSSVDAVYERALAAGYSPEAPPRDAEWGERFFHLCDPDGHELSFARPVDGAT